MAACNVEDFILSASALSSPTLDLSRKGITELPCDLPGCTKLEVFKNYSILSYQPPLLRVQYLDYLQ